MEHGYHFRLGQPCEFPSMYILLWTCSLIAHRCALMLFWTWAKVNLFFLTLGLLIYSTHVLYLGS